MGAANHDGYLATWRESLLEIETSLEADKAEK